MIPVYLDEDFVDGARIRALRVAGLDVLSAGEAEMLGRFDFEHLSLASSLERLLLTHNAIDFAKLHAETIGRGEHHSGICIMVEELRYGPGEIARRLKTLAEIFAESGTRDQLLFLANFG